MISETFARLLLFRAFYIALVIFLLLFVYFLISVILTMVAKTKGKEIKKGVLKKRLIYCIICMILMLFFAIFTPELDSSATALTCYNTGYKSYKEGNYQKAIYYLQESIKLSPNGSRRKDAEQLLRDCQQQMNSPKK